MKGIIWSISLLLEGRIGAWWWPGVEGARSRLRIVKLDILWCFSIFLDAVDCCLGRVSRPFCRGGSLSGTGASIFGETQSTLYFVSL